MLSIKTVILIFFWAALGSSNIWDNILSQTLSPSPILLSESIHAKFRVPNYEMDGLVDLNVQLGLLTVTFGYQLGPLNIQIFKAQIELSNLLLSIKSLSKECQKYRVVLGSTNQPITIPDFNVSSKLQYLHLINLFFIYRGPAETVPGNSIYQFKPFLLGDPKYNLPETEKEIIASNSFKFFLQIDQEGKVCKAFVGENREKEVPLNAGSTVKNALNCPGEVQQITQAQIRTLFQQAYDQRLQNPKQMP